LQKKGEFMFSNKVVLVTGGSQGIGKEIAKQFLKQNAKVIVFDIKKPNYTVDYFKVDVSKENEIISAMKNIKQLDILVNNAGIYFQKSVEDTEEKDLDKIIGVNFKGPYFMCKHCLPLLKKSEGNIINISSGLGVKSEPESPAYCSTKAALIMLTKCLAKAYAQKGVRFNSVLPGPIDTPLLRTSFKTQKEIDEYAKTNPIGRIGTVKDVANIVLFLASEKAGYVTGGTYNVDGGEYIS